MDGGIRISDNADLAKWGLIVIILPMGTGGMTLPGSTDLEAQVKALRSLGSNVDVIEPDNAAREVMGHNSLSAESCAAAFEARRRQDRAHAGAARAAGGVTSGRDARSILLKQPLPGAA